MQVAPFIISPWPVAPSTKKHGNLSVPTVRLPLIDIPFQLFHSLLREGTVVFFSAPSLSLLCFPFKTQAFHVGFLSAGPNGRDQDL